jgi:hypothetical protein
MQYDLLIKSISSRGDTRFIDLQKKLENNVSNFTFYPPFWRLFNKKLSDLKIDFLWEKLKYSSDDKPIVDDKTPGIYMFVIQPAPTIFESYNFVMYIGMTSDGLKERLNNGYRMPSTIKSRPNIHRMILDYGNFLYWYYLPLPKKNNKELLEIEENLIGFFCDPPINKKDAPYIITQATKSKMA